MSGLGKALLALAVLAVTTLGTFAYATWRCRQEAEGTQRLLAEAQQKQQTAEAQNLALQQRLDRLRVWGELLQLQKEINAVHAVINQLNFGNAIQALDRIEKGIQRGDSGELFKQRAAELVPLLAQAKQSLRQTDPAARNYLVELEQRAFAIIAGASVPGELPGLAPAPPGEALPTPSPLPTASPEMTATPEASGSPTPRPSPTPKTTPTPAPIVP
jgi:hypothetical protein